MENIMKRPVFGSEQGSLVGACKRGTYLGFL
jgi:hypothetical protein